MSDDSIPDQILMDKGFKVGLVLAILTVVIYEATRLCLRLRVTSEVSVALLPLLIFWNILVNLYLVYHRVTLPLPAWLTSGHPLAYGGMKSNVCSGPEASGTWPCFPSDLGAWYADVTGTRGWKHFFQPPPESLLCLLCLAVSIGMLAFLFAVIRDPGFLFEVHDRRAERRRRRNAERNADRAQCKRCTHCTDIELVQLVDSEKQ